MKAPSKIYNNVPKLYHCNSEGSPPFDANCGGDFIFSKFSKKYFKLFYHI